MANPQLRPDHSDSIAKPDGIDSTIEPAQHEDTAESDHDDSTIELDDPVENPARGQHVDERDSNRFFQTSEAYWNDDQSTAHTGLRNLPPATHVADVTSDDANKSTTTPSDPPKARQAMTPPWVRFQIYEDPRAEIAASTAPISRRRRSVAPPPSPTNSIIRQAEGNLETDEAMAKRLQEQYTKEAGLGRNTSHDSTSYATGRASGNDDRWGGLHIDGASRERYEDSYAPPLGLQSVRWYEARYPDRPKWVVDPEQDPCWRNRAEHLMFKDGCFRCHTTKIECHEHSPAVGYCFQHGFPRSGGYGLPFLYDDGVSQLRNAASSTAAPKHPSTPRDAPSRDEHGSARPSSSSYYHSIQALPSSSENDSSRHINSSDPFIQASHIPRQDDLTIATPSRSAQTIVSLPAQEANYEEPEPKIDDHVYSEASSD